MAIRYSIDNAQVVAPGIWEATLSPADVRSLGRSPVEGTRSVIGLRNLNFERGRAVSFSGPDIVVFAIGATDDALLLDLSYAAVAPSPKINAGPKQHTPVSMGDEAFLKSCRELLGAEVSTIAQELLRRVRRHHEGELKEGKARKWVNAPSNFFTITPQNRNQAFRVSIKGSPTSHLSKRLGLTPGRKGYSEFVLRDSGDLDEAVSLILESAKR
jgi:hypothetical protein